MCAMGTWSRRLSLPQPQFPNSRNKGLNHQCVAPEQQRLMWWVGLREEVSLGVFLKVDVLKFLDRLIQGLQRSLTLRSYMCLSGEAVRLLLSSRAVPQSLLLNHHTCLDGAGRGRRRITLQARKLVSQETRTKRSLYIIWIREVSTRF